MKIVYCTDSICYAGGIQRITIAKANALADIVGNEVWIIVTDNKKEPVLPINPKINLIDLKIDYFEDDWKGYYYVLKAIIFKRKKHKKLLLDILNKILPDVVISTGTSEKNFLPYLNISSNPAFIREIHSAKNYRIRHAQNIKSKIAAYAGDFYDYSLKIKRYDRIVVLTNEDKTSNWGNNKKVIVIPNPIASVPRRFSEGKNHLAIAAGRLEYPKNFQEMIRIWEKVCLKHPDWILQIWGEGSQHKELETEISNRGLSNNIYLMGYSPDVLAKMSNSSIFLLTSHIEGFSLVLVEAMSVGVVPISYNCSVGPKDIITDGIDGFLVDQYNIEMMVNKICFLIENESKRIDFGVMARKKAMNYSMDTITNQWMKLFCELKKL